MQPEAIEADQAALARGLRIEAMLDEELDQRIQQLLNVIEQPAGIKTNLPTDYTSTATVQPE
jgi:hypothetical protein